VHGASDTIFSVEFQASISSSMAAPAQERFAHRPTAAWFIGRPGAAPR
jgi:hypothetical protein